MLLHFMRMQFCKIKLYKASVAANSIFSVLEIYVMFSLYRLLPDSGYSQSYLLQYVILAVLLEQTAATARIPIFCKTVKKGTVVKYYKYPLSLYVQFFYEELGETFFSILCNSPLLLFALIVAGRPAPSVFLFFTAFLLSQIVSILLTLNVFSLTFLLWNYKSSKAILTAVSGIFSGSMIPLILLPKWFTDVAYKTPFSYMVDFPIHVLLDDKPDLYGLILQCGWIVFSYAAGKVIYKAVEPKMNIYGG